MPELDRLVRELSKAARLPVPRLYLSPADQPNLFAVGRGPRTATICCTEGLLRVLDEAELRGVLAHELAHVSSRDVLASSVSAGLATVITFPAGLARFARPTGRSARSMSAGSAAAGSAAAGLCCRWPCGRWLCCCWRCCLGLGLGPRPGRDAADAGVRPGCRGVVRLAVTREREYRADASGALLSGDPLALASALRTIDAGTAELALAPDGPRTSVGHLMIASPFRPRGLRPAVPDAPARRRASPPTRGTGRLPPLSAVQR